jgi:hypothetical protein
MGRFQKIQRVYIMTAFPSRDCVTVLCGKWLEFAITQFSTTLGLQHLIGPNPKYE